MASQRCRHRRGTAVSHSALYLEYLAALRRRTLTVKLWQIALLRRFPDRVGVRAARRLDQSDADKLPVGRCEDGHQPDGRWQLGMHTWGDVPVEPSSASRRHDDRHRRRGFVVALPVSLSHPDPFIVVSRAAEDRAVPIFYSGSAHGLDLPPCRSAVSVS